MNPHLDSRLQFADDLFLRRHRGLGAPVVNQFSWRLSQPYDAAVLSRLATRLSTGPLARRVQRAWLPLARDRWVSDPTPVGPGLSDAILPVDSTMCWLSAQAAVPLDPHTGPAWRLSATNTDDGGALVSLCAAHAVGDGATMIEALVGSSPADLPAPATGLGRIADEARDGAAQVATAARWIRLRRAHVRSTPPAAPAAHGPAAQQPAEPAAEGPADWEIPVVVAELDTEAISAVAGQFGGTPSTWFLAALARLSATLTPRDPVPVAVPVSGRVPGDLRSNSTRIALLRLDEETLATRDLGRVRASAKAAYASLAAAGPGASPLPLPLIQMLPDRVLKLVPEPPPAAVLASSLGSLPDRLVDAVGPGVVAIGSIAHQPGARRADYAAHGGLAAWLSATGPITTLNVAGMLPAVLPSRATLQDALTTELAVWGLQPRWW